MPEERNQILRRLKYRVYRQGLLELDLLFSRAAKNFEPLSMSELHEIDRFLSQEVPDMMRAIENRQCPSVFLECKE